MDLFQCPVSDLAVATQHATSVRSYTWLMGAEVNVECLSQVRRFVLILEGSG